MMAFLAGTTSASFPLREKKVVAKGNHFFFSSPRLQHKIEWITVSHSCVDNKPTNKASAAWFHSELLIAGASGPYSGRHCAITFGVTPILNLYWFTNFSIQLLPTFALTEPNYFLVNISKAMEDLIISRLVFKSTGIRQRQLNWAKPISLGCCTQSYLVRDFVFCGCFFLFLFSWLNFNNEG